MTATNATVTATEVVLPGKVDPSGLRLVQRARLKSEARLDLQLRLASLSELQRVCALGRHTRGGSTASASASARSVDRLRNSRSASFGVALIRRPLQEERTEEPAGQLPQEGLVLLRDH